MTFIKNTCQKIKYRKMANFHFIFIFFLIFKKAYSDHKISWKCTPEFCDDYIQRYPCPPLDPACSNSSISLVIPSPTVCNCCEHCFVFRDLGEDCLVGHPGQPLPKIMCKPGTTCYKGKCIKMNHPDPDFYRGYECEGGRCYCATVVNKKIQKIFGSFAETKDITKEKQCRCSIFAYKAKQTVNLVLPIQNAFIPTVRCLPNGQFDPLQCIDNMCGCVNRTTGVWDTSVRKVTVAALGPNNPKCFDPSRHKIGHYYKKCEKERNDLMSDISLQELGEIDILLSHTVECTPDGEYGKPEL